jgi:solute carrier family 25 oxoglutarate transporter 11
MGDSIAETLRPFVCGGASAMLGSTCIHPIDLVKVRVQLSPDAKPSAIKIIQGVVKSDGVAGLYSGLSAALTRQATYGTARIGLHRTFSNKLVEHNDGQPIGLGLKTLSGLSSGAIA